jgi:hypothetical protein
MGVSPEEHIRRYLEGTGGETDATVHDLLTTFGVAAEDDSGRARIMASLAGAGVHVTPGLRGLAEDARVRVALAPRGAEHRPEVVARQIVERHGGSYSVSVRELLGLFGLEQRTETACEDISVALFTVEVGTQPNLAFVKGDDDEVRLFSSEPQEASPGPARAPERDAGNGASPRPSSAHH